MLNGVFHYSASGRWTKPFPAQDIGIYPSATGQIWEDMAVEEVRNMLIATAAIAHMEGNAAYTKKHLNELSNWADYLFKNGFDPKKSVGYRWQVTLYAMPTSIKAIMSISSNGKLASMLGEPETAP